MAAIRTKTGRIINIKPKVKNNLPTSYVGSEFDKGQSFIDMGQTAPENTNNTIDMESQGDEALSPTSGVNKGQSFNYSTGLFTNGNAPSNISKVTSSPTTSSRVVGPSTASNLTVPQSTVMVGGIKKSKYLPETLELRKADQIGIDKKEETPPSFDFNTQLSSLYGKGLTDKSAIFSELSKDGSFASLDNIKQQEYVTNMTQNIKDMMEAKSKADMTNENFDPAEYAKQKGFDIQSGDAKEIQKGWDEISQTLKYKGTIYDNQSEDLQFKKDQNIKAIEQNMDKIRTSVDRDIEDLTRQSQQTIAMGEKVGALKGYKGSGYVQGLANVHQEAMRNIQRLQSDLARAESLSGEDKALAMKEYETNLKRHKEAFDYDMRSVMDQSNAELNNVMGKYSGEKLGEMLDNLSYDVIQKRLNIENQYIQNMQASNQVISQQFDQFKEMDDYTDKQRSEFTSILNANDGEALASMSAKELENFVSQGYLSEEQGAAYYQSMVSKSIGALSQYGIPTQEDIDTIINSIKNGSTPLQSVAGVIQNNSDRYSSVKDKFMTVGANSSVFDTATKQFINQPGGSTGVSTNYTGKQVQAVAPQTVQQNVQNVTQQYKVGSQGGQCGSFVNNYLQGMGLGRMFIDPIDKKAQLSNSQTPTVGSVAIMDSPSSPQYGHVAIVTKVNPDGSFQTIESNKAGEEKVFTRTMKAGSAKYGFFDPQLGLSQGDGGKSSGVGDRYNNTLYSTILGSKKTGPQQETFKEGLSGLQGDDEATQRYLEQQYVDTLPTDTKKTLEMFDSTSSQAESALDILYGAKVQGGELNNSIRSKIGRNVDDITAFFGGGLEDSTKKYRQLRASIDASQADYRNALFGASLTPGEKASADTFIVDKNDTIDTVIAKLEGQKKTSNIMRSNLIKKKLGLPVEKIINPFNTENKELVATTKTTQTKPLQTTQPTVKTNTGKRDVTKELNAMFGL